MQQSNRKRKNVIIRDLTDDDRAAIDVVIADTGFRQASKAIMRAVHSFARSSLTIRNQAVRIKQLEAENHVLLQNARLIIEANKQLESILISKKDNEKTNDEI
ncbi:hypothetical protein H8788_14385 [Parabacteroides faecis]|uniref:hypothetical protein n=1 Tax=Parabacteroides TaxID=375288 RepID=UPI000F0030C8|nr:MULTISPECIES: hypothetical protein [Parabacteroides]MBC8618930.1 hypothetical protein [Parabacteroides faecis]RHS00053.1 hypothetical protein DWW23_05270 [Parabacteroides sp. AF14-59]